MNLIEIIADALIARRRRKLAKKIVEEFTNAVQITSPSKIEEKDLMIDCDADPEIPGFCRGYSVIEHRRSGILRWNPAEAKAYGMDIYGADRPAGYACDAVYTETIDAEVAKLPVLNANVLFRLLRKQVLIPAEMRFHSILFRGTLYRDDKGNPCVLGFRRWGNRSDLTIVKIGDRFEGHEMGWMLDPRISVS